MGKPSIFAKVLSLDEPADAYFIRTSAENREMETKFTDVSLEMAVDIPPLCLGGSVRPKHDRKTIGFHILVQGVF